MDKDGLLRTGILAVQSGDMQRARIFLARAIQNDRSSDQAWLWLSRALTDKEQRRKCLTEALRLNPENAFARDELDALNSTGPTSSIRNASNQESSDLPEEGITAAPLDLSDNPAEQPRKRRLKPIVLGMVAGVIISITFGGFLLLNGLLGEPGFRILELLNFAHTQQIAGSAATLPPIWTRTPSPPPSPTRTPVTPSPSPAPTATLLYQDRYATAQPQISRLMDRMGGLECATVINAWSNIIEFLPEYGPAYYWRAKEVKCDTGARGDVNAYVETMYTVLEDINTAIELDPDATGDYFLLRSDVFNSLASTYDLRSDRDYLSSFALDDIQRAVQLGSSNPLSSRDIAFQLTYLNRCQEAITETKRLQRLILPGEAPSAGIETAFASAYLCLGQYTAALASIERAITILPSEPRRYTRAMVLYALGRSSEARAELDDLIAAEPTYGGYRYHLRALIQMDSGDPDAARSDLLMGFLNSWGDACLPALVQGLVTLDSGDTDNAVDFFRYAESTCSSSSRPIWDRALRELAKLDAAPLTAETSLTVTPAPAAKPIDYDTSPNNLPQPPAIEKSYLQGTGVMEFRGPAHITMHLSSAQPIEVTRVFAMEIEIEPGIIPTGNQVTIYLLSPENGFWSMYPWSGESIQVIQPERFVYPDGGLYLSTMVDGEGVTIIDNVRVHLKVLSKNLGQITLGEDL
jgi:tetratricopeptide (TPR) repeat protein